MVDRRTKSLKELVTDNLPWIITTLLTVGGLVVTIRYQGEAIASTEVRVDLQHTRIETIEKNLIQIEVIQKDISTMKSDMKELKLDIQNNKIEILTNNKELKKEMMANTSELKTDIKEIKSIILKPAFGS